MRLTNKKHEVDKLLALPWAIIQTPSSHPSIIDWLSESSRYTLVTIELGPTKPSKYNSVT